MLTQKRSFAPAAKTSEEKPSTMEVPSNPFSAFAMRKGVETTSQNGSLKLSTSGSTFVDQFSNTAMYLGQRNPQDIFNDQEALWTKNPLLSICFIFYLRIITRIVTLFDGTKTATPQRGQGLRYESCIRMYWLAVKYPETFWKNITLFISVGGWRDVFFLLETDCMYNNWDKRLLDWNKFSSLIKAGLQNPSHSELIKKWLPAIKTRSQIKTIECEAQVMVGKWLCGELFGAKDDRGRTYKQYRLLKSSGKAHTWQQKISQGKFLEIDFSTIHGRALAQIVGSEFLAKNGLTEKYTQWIMAQPVAKFMGYPYELYVALRSAGAQAHKVMTIDKQFQGLVETARLGLIESGRRVMCVLDDSGSMSATMVDANGKALGFTAWDAAVSSLVFFNEMYPKSMFYNQYLAFSNKCEWRQLQGKTLSEKLMSMRHRSVLNTNLAAVFQVFVDYRHANPQLDENQVPNTLLLFSDGEFDRLGFNKETAFTAGKRMIKEAGYSEEFVNSFSIVLCDIRSSNRTKPHFESFANEPSFMYFSGWDLSPLAFLFGVEGVTKTENGEVKVPSTAEELMMAALSQEIMQKIEL